MYLSAAQAHDVIDPVPDSALCDPTGRWAYKQRHQLALYLVDACTNTPARPLWPTVCEVLDAAYR
jgi:hypothetical protein